MSGRQREQQESSFVSVCEEDLCLQSLVERVQADSAGAVVTFSGVTRDNFKGKRVLHLEYEAYKPMAERKLQVQQQTTPVHQPASQ